MAGATKRDYYEVLGVARDADEATIKRAFKRLAIKYHPDHCSEPDAEEKFREINEAYQVLSDPTKRQMYDQHGFDGLNSMGQGAQGFSSQDFSDIFGDIFGDFFGGGGGASRGGPRVQPGQDMRIVVELSLEEAVSGVTRKINLKSLAECENCHGQGSKNPSNRKECPRCHGQGFIQSRQGFFAVRQECPDCHGAGFVFTDPCPKCHGEGRVEKTRSLNIDIPAGVDSGDRIRLRGAGMAGVRGAPSGDLFVDIRVRPHDIFTRDGNDLHCEINVPFVTAALGGQMEIPTLEGKVNITIPEGTQPGRVMRLANKGVKSTRSRTKGHLYCHINVEVPTGLSEEQKDLLRRFDELSHKGGASKEASKSRVNQGKNTEEGVFSSMKNFFNDLKK